MILSSQLDHARVARWVGERTGLSFKPPYSCLAATDGDGQITAACVFQNWTEHDIEITAAADSFPRRLLFAIRRYVVDQLGCSRVTFRQRSSAYKARLLAERIGARVEGRVRKFYGDEDAIILGLLKEDFPYGQRPRTSSST